MKPYVCPGCDAVLPSVKSAGVHGKYSKDCTPEMRFWGRIKITDGCWLWQGAVNTTGYGMANWSDGEKNIVAHRLAYRMLVGEVPEGMRVCHTCDTPRCCNPAHMFLGTQKDNAADCKAKGRNTGGRKDPHAAVNEQVVREMRRLKAEGTKTIDLARRFGVSPSAVSAILTRRTWSNLE